MAEEFAELKVAITASLKDFSAKMGEFEKQIGGLKKPVEETNKGFKQIFTGFVAGQLTVDALKGAFSSLVNTMRQSIDAYDKQFLAESSLRQSLGYTSKALIEQASAIQKVTRFGDEEVLQAQAMMAMFIKEESTIKRLTPAIVDFAAAKGLGVAQAADLVTKSVASSTNMLSRYGIQIEGAAGSTERAQSAVESLTKAFGGQAEAMAKGGSGPMIQMNNAISDMQEKLGQAVSEGINPFVGAINKKVIPALDAWLTRTLDIKDAEGKFEESKRELLRTEERLEELRARGTDKIAIAVQEKKIARLKEEIGATEKARIVEEEKKTATEKAAEATAKDTARMERLEKAIVTGKNALDIYRSTTAKLNAEWGAAIAEQRMTTEQFFLEKTERTRKEIDLERQLLNTKLAAEKDENKRAEIKAQIQIQEINGETKLLQIEQEKAQAISKSNEKQEKARTLLDKMRADRAKEAISAESDPIKRMRMEHEARINEMLAQDLDIDKMNLSKEEKEKAHQDLITSINRTAQVQRDQIRKMEIDSILSTGSQMMGMFADTMQSLFEAGGEKSEGVFNMMKAANMAQTVMNTAQAVMKMWTLGMPLGPIMAGLVGVQGAAQLAVIASQKFEPPKAALGGAVFGPSHARGGVKMELEGGEHIIRKSSVAKYGHRALDAINLGRVPASALSRAAAGVTIAGSRAASGGAVPGGDMAGGGVTIANFFDQTAFEQFLASDAGRRALRNHMSRDSFAMRQAMHV